MTSKPRVGLFVTCLVDLMRPSVGFAAVKLLEQAGCDVFVPDTQTCCGQPAWNSGADKDAAAIVGALAPAFGVIVCVQARHKGAPAGVIAAHAQQANPEAEIVVAEGMADARRIALARAGGGAVYVAGGLFLAAEFKAVHVGRDPASLAFF